MINDRLTHDISYIKSVEVGSTFRQYFIIQTLLYICTYIFTQTYLNGIISRDY